MAEAERVKIQEMAKTIEELRRELGAVKAQKSDSKPAAGDLTYGLRPQPGQANYHMQHQPQYNQTPLEGPTAMSMFADAVTKMYMEGTKYFQAMSQAVQDLGRYQSMHYGLAGGPQGARAGASYAGGKTYAAAAKGK